MVKASRRVKRIKRSKKHVHRARGRKTNRRRYTRRQRGGRKIPVCERSGFDLIGTSTGITISYDDETQKYTIGNESYAKLKLMPRYKNAMDIVDDIRRFDPNAPVVLTQQQFNTFKEKYCSEYATIGGKEQCELIKNFKPHPVAAAAPAPAAAAASSAAEFDKRCVITSKQVSFLGTPIPWQDHNIPLEITTFDFAQKNDKLMDFLKANVDKFVFFKTKHTYYMETKTEKLFKDTIDAIFLSIHFKKTRENNCALAIFKDKDSFNLVERIYGSKQTYPHFLLYPNHQPGTTDQENENVATCYIGAYAGLFPITSDDFMKVIDQFATYKTVCKDLSGQMSSISLD